MIPRAGRRPGRRRRVLAVVLMALGLVAALRVAVVGYGPVVSAERVVHQVNFLHSAIERGRAADMQAYFPEGEFFTVALAAGAMARAADPGLDEDWLRDQRDRLDSPALTGRFGSGMSPEHGIFQAGWSLSIAVDVAQRTGEPADRELVRRKAGEIDAALTSDPDGFLASYPGQLWPCDTVVAAAALAQAAQLLDQPAWLDTVRGWRTRVGTHLDPATGLLPHRVDATGALLTGSRGSSQSIIQAFWPVVSTALDGRVDIATWQRFTDRFVVRRAGLVGVSEYPRGTAGAGDVDSGPLVAGVSASASAVTLAAARQVGDVGLADSLDREAELLGAGFTWSGRRSYAFGQLPVGDAFLAWSRTRPAGSRIDLGTPVTAWPALIAGAAAPLVVALAVWPWRAPRRRRAGAAPPPPV